MWTLYISVELGELIKNHTAFVLKHQSSLASTYVRCWGCVSVFRTCEVKDDHECRDVRLCSFWNNAHTTTNINLCSYMRSRVHSQMCNTYPLDIKHRRARLLGCWFTKYTRLHSHHCVICSAVCCKVTNASYKYKDDEVYMCSLCKQVGLTLLSMDIIVVLNRFVNRDVITHIVMLLRDVY